MKKAHAVYVWLLLAPGICLSFTNVFTMPAVWTTDFVIEAGMKNAFTHHELSVTYTYDSCVYTSSRDGIVIRRSFALTDSDRTEILYHMQLLEVTNISYAYDPFNVDETASASFICLHQKKEFCIEEGPLSKLKGEKPGNYYKAFDYLFTFAEQHEHLASN